MTAEFDRIWMPGFVNGYEVLVQGDTVYVLKGATIVTEQRARGIEAFLANVKDLRMGLEQLEDGVEAIYLCDKGAENYGYIVNLRIPSCSAWRHVPIKP